MGRSMSRVVVVGAGLSGLACAYRLARAGVEVVVLEARDRAGGRAWRLPLAEGVTFDAGCEVLDEAHGALLGLAAELGVRVRRADPWAGHGEADRPTWLVHGSRSYGDPPLDPAELSLYRALEERIAELARQVDPLHPEELDGAGALDAETLGSWLSERGASPRLLAVAETWYAVASSSVPIAHMSLLAMAAKVAAGAGSGGLRLRLDGGPSALAERLADELGERVRLGAQVVAITEERDGVSVRLLDGRIERGAGAVVAIPLTVQRDLRFEPPLPPHRRLALAHARYGDAVKAAFAFDERPPGDRPVAVLTESGLVYEPDPGRPLLGLFAGSGPARRLSALDLASREAALVTILRTAFEGASPRSVVSVSWSRERFTQGSYLILGPGDLLSWGRRLAEPQGRVHFAGSEASSLPSYIEGAIRAAERTALEVSAVM